MQLKFNIKETIETEIFYGYYEIFILGGFYLETNPDFHIDIINLDTNKSIELTEKFLKTRDKKDGQRAIKFYSFEITDYGVYRVSVHNYEDIMIKHHYPSFLLPDYRKRTLDEISIFIT